MGQLKNITLKEFLRGPNPKVTIVDAPSLSDDGKKRKNNSSSKNPSWIVPKKTREWANFNLESFDFLYSESPLQEILGRSEKFNDYPTIAEFPFCKIWDEDCLEALVVRSNLPIILDALKFAQTHVQGQNSHGSIFVSVSDP